MFLRVPLHSRRQCIAMVNFLCSFVLSLSFLNTKHISSSVALANTLIATPTIPNFFIQARSALVHWRSTIEPRSASEWEKQHVAAPTHVSLQIFRSRICGLTDGSVRRVHEQTTPASARTHQRTLPAALPLPRSTRHFVRVRWP